MPTIIDALREFVRQRPGIEPANYGSFADYRRESRAVTQDLHDALTLLRQVELSPSMTAALAAELSTGRGRLTATATDTGWRIDYTTGQYWPTEYRRAVARACAEAMWDHVREASPRYNGDDMRAYFRRAYGRRIANRYFN